MKREPSTLSRDISPPPTRKASTQTNHKELNPSLAAIEAGQGEITDHLEYFANHLAAAYRPCPDPRLSIEDFRSLYKRNEHKHGCHFVVHQHDHPVSGVHYDLRLQFSETSSVSFAVPYGLPGNPNSIRPNRMAIETRVHNLWVGRDLFFLPTFCCLMSSASLSPRLSLLFQVREHLTCLQNNLIESASHPTGSLLIWDTGEYEILPWKERTARMTDDELSDEDTRQNAFELSHRERLFAAFQQRHIRLRLHGTKLPPNYTVSLRLPSKNDRSAQPRKPKRKRRRLDPAKTQNGSEPQTDSDSDSAEAIADNRRNEPIEGDDEDAAALASEDDEDATIRANNAYTGATNTINSVHQRHWFLTLDRRNSGFRKSSSNVRWEGPWEPFFVRGRDVEASIVTGRNADEVMADEGVSAFRGRKMWRPILE